MLPYRRDLKMVARELRGAVTPAEGLLWSRLRRKQVLGLQFYRQKPILDYIVDFYAPKPRLIIELDGRHHADEDQSVRDRRRDEVLAELDLEILRFPNTLVVSDLDGVVESIRRVAAARL